MQTSSAMPTQEPRVDDLTRRELEPDAASVVADAIQHGRELVHAEFALAKAELKEELSRIQTGAMAMALGVTIGATSLLVAVVAFAIQLGSGAWMVAVAGLCAAVLGGIAAWWGQRRLVTPRLAITRGSLARGAMRLKQVTDDKPDSP
ncbi:MAG TPA: phage holin family protein [Polyangiaceae bacterium]|nr:phage holin family protein [Polyangiaceae bacterium]